MAEHPSIHAFERFLTLVAKVIAPFSLIIFFSYLFIVSGGFVDGPSMEPYAVDDQTFYVNKLVYLLHSPERQDVIQYIDASSTKHIIKRIVGLPNETVYIKRGTVFVAGPGKSEAEAIELDESSYIRENVFTKPADRTAKNQTIHAGPDEYIVLGDNRGNSIDSRFKGPIHRSHIVGRVAKNILHLFYAQ